MATATGRPTIPRSLVPAALAAPLLAPPPGAAQTYADCALATARLRGTSVSAVSEQHVVQWTGAGAFSARMRIDGTPLACNAVAGAGPVVVVLPSETPDLADTGQKAACISHFATIGDRPAATIAPLWSLRWPDGAAWVRLRAEGPWDVDCWTWTAGRGLLDVDCWTWTVGRRLCGRRDRREGDGRVPDALIASKKLDIFQNCF